MATRLMCLLMLACCGTTVLGQAPVICNPVQRDCAEPSDIVFVLDRSSSISEEQYALARTFIVNVTKRFQLSSNEIQVGMAVFATDAIVEFHLNEHHNHSALEAAIFGGQNFTLGTTHIELAMDLLRTSMFVPKNGARPEAVRIVIVVTDGVPSAPDMAHRSYQRVKDLGIHIVAIGVKNAVLGELLELASSPDDVFYVESFDILASISRVIQNRTCELVTTVPACSSLLDIVIILDSSMSIGREDYSVELNFAAELASRFRLGVEGVRIGVVTYSHQAAVLFHLNEYSDSGTIAELLRNSSDTYEGSDTRTDAALELVKTEEMFSKDRGGRLDAPDVIVILTDAEHTETTPTRTAAVALKSVGIQIVAVGVGERPYIDALHEIASSTDDVFFVDDVEALQGITDNLTSIVCPKVGPCIVRQVCNMSMDIVFLLDSSGKENAIAYRQMLEFVEAMTRMFDVGPTEVQFGAVLFGNNYNYRQLFFLNTYHDQQNLSEAILTAPFLGSDTIAITNATNYVRTEMFKTEHGGRNDVMKMVVLVHGFGLRSGEGSTAFNNLKGDDVRVIGIGLGSINNARSLVTDYDTDKFAAEGFYDLENILEKAGAWICDVPKNDMKCTSSLNILFAVQSTSRTEFYEGLRFAEELSAQFKLSTTDTDHGMIALSIFNRDHYQEVISLNQYVYPNQLSRAITSAPYLGGLDGLDNAVHNAKHTDPFAHRPLPKEKRVVVFLSNGHPSFDRLDLVKLHTLENNDIISVPLGNHPNRTALINLASKRENALSDANRAAMEYIIDFASNSTCSYTTIP